MNKRANSGAAIALLHWACLRIKTAIRQENQTRPRLEPAKHSQLTEVIYPAYMRGISKGAPNQSIEAAERPKRVHVVVSEATYSLEVSWTD